MNYHLKVVLDEYIILYTYIFNALIQQMLREKAKWERDLLKENSHFQKLGN